MEWNLEETFAEPRERVSAASPRRVRQGRQALGYVGSSPLGAMPQPCASLGWVSSSLGGGGRRRDAAGGSGWQGGAEGGGPIRT